jgi:glutamine synthetase
VTTRQEILAQAEQGAFALLRFLYCDNANIVRGKTVISRKLADFIETGVGLTMAMQGFSPTERIADAATVGPVGEIRLVPDPETFVDLPYAQAQAAMLCDMMTLDGSPWNLCPRATLKRVLVSAANDGLSFLAGFEHEFYLLSPEAGGWKPFDQSLCFSTTGMNSAGPLMLEVVDALHRQGVEPVQYYPELGPGQQELSIQHHDILRAADNAVIARETIRGIAGNHDLRASFAPKPFIDQAGSGSHVHLSAWRDGENAFYASSDRFGLSTLAYAFIAGVLRHLPGLLALTCPSLNSYQRLAPGMWSSAFVCYGPDNREAAVRIASVFRGREQASTNIEIKAIDGSANPYLALAGLIAAGLDGVRRNLSPGEAVVTNPATLTDDQRAQMDIRPFPQSIVEAAKALEEDEVLQAALGERIVAEALAVRRSEAADLDGLEPAALAARYRSLY